MSSTSSSDCDSCDCSQCTYSLENNHNDYGKLVRAPLKSSRHVPIYATMAHPLIYYAEVPQPLNRRQTNDQPKKDNPFKKAFKWYTQERTLSNKHDTCLERSGFADWLDGKYVQYLIESGQQPGPPTTDEPQPPSIANVESHPCPPCPAKNKKFARIKSPWRKRRRSGNDSGDVPEKCTNKSCEFLLKPKDLSRAASDNCYNTPTSGGKSNATVTSSNMPCNVKCSARSHSLSDVGREKSVPKHGETVPHTVQEGPRAQEQELTSPPCYVCHQDQAERVPSKKQSSTIQAKTICKCHQEKVPVVKKVSSKKQNEANQPCAICKCLLEKVPEEKKTLSKEQDSTTQPNPCCMSHQETAPEVEQVSSEDQSPTNQSKLSCKSSQKKGSEIEHVPSKKQDSTNQPRPPCCICHQENLPEVKEGPLKKQISINQPGPCCKCTQKNVSEEGQEPSNDQISTNKPRPCMWSPGKVPGIEQVPAKGQGPIKQPQGPCCKCLQENVPKVEQEASKEQNKTNQPKPPCCHLKKVPEVVQVPSKSRTVEESCQFPQEKVVPVNEETQYESARPEPPRCTQNVKPRVCSICNAPIALLPCPPLVLPMLGLPLQVQSSTICRTVTLAEINEPNKQLQAEKPNVSCSCYGKSKTKVNNQSQHQHEPRICQKVTAPCPDYQDMSQSQPHPEPCICQKVPASNPNDCHEVSQMYGPIPIRRQSYSTVNINEETGEFSIVKEVAVVSKFTRSVTCVTNEAAQTSDHSIKFDKDGACCHYPLFFKIIYADVLKNECCT